MTLNNIFLCSLIFLLSCGNKKEASTVQSTSEEASEVTPELMEVGTTEISVEDLQDMLMAGDAPLVVDVRTPEEVATGTIQPDVIHIDINGDGFEEQVAQLDPNETYVVYCKAGGRSSKAQEYMLAQGFQHVLNMTGGITAWDSAGYYKVVPAN